MRFRFISKENLLKLQKSPGVYAFLARRSLGEGGKKGAKFLYIGKAANLRERVKNHLPERSEGRRRTNVLRPHQPSFRGNLFINQADKIGYIKTDSEIEALILEAKLIKKYQPKYNVMWRDDKNYFYVGITKENFPTVFITHQPKPEYRIWNIEYRIKKHSKFNIQHSKFYYVGPFVDGRALKQTLNVLRRIFPYRTCKPYSARPCLWYQLDRCPGPCLLGSKLAKEMPKLEKTIKNDSQRNIRNLKKILEGGKNHALKNLKKEMKNASKIRDFEIAAKIRDQIWALEKILSHSKILDYPSEAKGEEERMFFDRPEPETSRKRRSPDSYVWRETERNLRKILKIKGRVKRIEAYDVSNIQGQNATGSMVTFINGKPDKNFYRKFKIRIEGKPDDVAMIKEVLTRRFQHPEWGWPDLILIDGGKAQLNAAVLSIKYQVLSTKIPVMALAKKRSVAKPRTKPRTRTKFGTGQSRTELRSGSGLRFGAGENKLFIEGKKQPVLLKTLPREIFNLILQLRDEAHRFAIAYHRKLRDIDPVVKF